MNIVEIHIERIERARRDGYDKGFAAGEAVGSRSTDKVFDHGLGIGCCVGVGIGVILTLLVGPLL
ncbi:hypothetical protein [Luteibacter sp.]|uniref:hypothetical protein n=1 Tax=Luteibacter sp. TaxID=1886636 RepID=UPI002808323C|nr:hypothetical protein [Luteibacter sp.]MDQ8050716.1 hypothetical protein [Luteibacter sp.]